VVRELIRYLLRRRLRTVSGDHRPGAIDEKFGKIPRDVSLAFLIRLFGFQEIVEIAGTVAIDFYLGEHGKGDIVFGLSEFEYFSVRTGFLRTKLITGETENGKPVIFVAFV